jgi:glycosyltransferase involved in cell wall biosynthesis
VEPDVSIIIPTYNRAGLVPRAIDSALGQTFASLDVIVVDDGSTDGTSDALRRYDDEPRVRVVRLDRNRGVTAAKNVGLANVSSRATYVGFLDSDDTLVPTAIETLVRAFDGDDTRYSQVFGWCVDSATGEFTGRMPYREGPVTYDDALSGRFSGEFWQLASRRLLGDRRFDERATGGESAVWWPLLKQTAGWLVPDVVRIYDTSGGDRVSTVAYSRQAAWGRMWAWHATLARTAPDLRRRYPRAYGGALVELAKWAALAGERSMARAASREAVRSTRSPRSVLIAALVLLPTGVVYDIATVRSRVRRIRATGARREAS